MVNSASNRNENQEYFLGGKGGRCVGLTNLPPSCADCLEISELPPSRALRVCTGFALPLFFTHKLIIDSLQFKFIWYNLVVSRQCHRNSIYSMLAIFEVYIVPNFICQFQSFISYDLHTKSQRKPVHNTIRLFAYLPEQKITLHLTKFCIF